MIASVQPTIEAVAGRCGRGATRGRRDAEAEQDQSQRTAHLPSLSPTLSVARVKKRPMRPTNSTRLPSQRSSARNRLGGHRQHEVRDEVQAGGLERREPRIARQDHAERNARARAACTKTGTRRRTPAGQKNGSGAVGSHCARKSSAIARIRSSLDIGTVGVGVSRGGQPTDH